MVEQVVTNKTLEKLKYDLVREGLVEYDIIEQAEAIALAQHINIGQALINSGFLSEDPLLKFLESKLHTPYVNLEDYTPDKKCLKYISYADAQHFKIIPLFKIEDVLTVAMADPFDLFAIDKIVETAGCAIEPVISSETSIFAKIDEYYKTEKEVCEIYTDNRSFDYDWRDELHKEDLSEEHIQKIIKAILKQAILENIHEVYFENIEQGLGINFKKNTEIIDRGYIPSLLTQPFILKLKSISNLDPTVSEVPQMGKLCFKVDEINLVASVSTFPTILEERIALAIYKPPKKLDSLITNKSIISTIKQAVEEPGIILVCGSALSGKTQVIYSILQEISNSSKNIMTIESISKYNLTNINQCELNENIGFNLDKALRFIEFQSPDIVYLEGIQTKEAFDYISGLVFKNKTIITEIMANNMDDLRKKLAFTEFEMFKSLISCMVFIHSSESIDVFDKSIVQKYLA
ncbi:MAG: Flp pilus assembly complex ATPase component TadA [bacterium]|nr:Flp pilus assembly complex ATPase component TadA [bacterium]